MAVFSVGEAICLVTPFHDRDLGLQNHVKYDSYLITFSQRPLNEHTHDIDNYSFLFFRQAN